MSDLQKKPMGIYVHVPFCLKRCNYCSFSSNAGVDKALQGQYVSTVLKEWKHYAVMGRRYQWQYETLYFGGGTPTVLDAEHLERLLAGITKTLDPAQLLEFTVEANPGTMTEQKLRLLRDYGCNRLSIGVQSFDPDYLLWLGRSHGCQEIYDGWQLARQMGWTNISMDLMYGLKDQTSKQWADTLRKALELDPEHISLYQLNVEADTPFGRRYPMDAANPLGQTYLVDEEESRCQYLLAREILLANGYNHYEISNYAKPGMESRHNLIYWSNHEYIGLGAGAAGYINGVRYTNIADLEAYARSLFGNREPRACEETITEKIAMEEEMMLNLRRAQGIEKEHFFKKFGRTIESLWSSAIKKYTSLGLMKENEKRLFLTPEGFLQSNQIIVEMIGMI